MTICWFSLVSGGGRRRHGIKSVKQFDEFIRDKVIDTFRPWAQEHGGEQFAALMVLNKNYNWNSFKFSPIPLKKNTIKTIQPPRDKLVNYAAALPALTKISKKRLKGGGSSEKKVEKFLHSEQCIFETKLKPLLDKYETNNNKKPEAIVLYSWIVPCFKQSCPSKETKGCTSHIIQELGSYTDQTTVIVAYTTGGGGMTGGTKCEETETVQKLKDANILVRKVRYNSKEEAIIEKLIKLGTLLETLE